MVTTTYSTDAQVKYRINITHANFDTQIDIMRVYAKAWIDTNLKGHETLVVGSEPQLIEEIEADYAGALMYEDKFEQTDETREKASWLRNRAKENLDLYIDKYHISPAKKRTTKGIKKNYSNQFYKVDTNDTTT
jgi:hypothetical protein